MTTCYSYDLQYSELSVKIFGYPAHWRMSSVILAIKMLWTDGGDSVAFTILDRDDEDTWYYHPSRGIWSLILMMIGFQRNGLWFLVECAMYFSQTLHAILCHCMLLLSLQKQKIIADVNGLSNCLREGGTAYDTSLTVSVIGIHTVSVTRQG